MMMSIDPLPFPIPVRGPLQASADWLECFAVYMSIDRTLRRLWADAGPKECSILVWL